MVDPDEAYEIVFDQLTDVIANLALRGDVARQYIAAPFSDILAAIALKAGGLHGLQGVIARLGDRLVEAARGEFPPIG